MKKQVKEFRIDRQMARTKAMAPVNPKNKEKVKEESMPYTKQKLRLHNARMLGVKLSEQGEANFLVFTYETLMNRKLRKILLKREVEFDIDELEGYREIAVDTIEGDNYHTLISSEDDRVRGHVLHLTRDELGVLDAWEDQYKRVKVKTASGKDVLVYILRVSNVVDYGQNIKVDLTADDLSMLKMAQDVGDRLLGEPSEESIRTENRKVVGKLSKILKESKHDLKSIDWEADDYEIETEQQRFDYDYGDQRGEEKWDDTTAVLKSISSSGWEPDALEDVEIVKSGDTIEISSLSFEEGSPKKMPLVLRVRKVTIKGDRVEIEVQKQSIDISMK
jgi:gamma-glutamylcyclotransferase (GGCT)/AIG2-like uncharacterized protein YtfP